MKLSVIIPCYNEEEVIYKNYQRVTFVLKNLISNNKLKDYELIYVDDGSEDNTCSILKRLAESDPKMKVIILSRNFGHQAALVAGLWQVCADAAVTLDADLQHPPEVIEEMIDKFQEGYDVVYGVSKKTKETDGFFKQRLPSFLFYKLMKLMKVNVIHYSGDFRLISKRVIEEFKKFHEVNIFIRGLIPYLGFNQTTIHYKRQKRAAGKPSYSFSKLLGLAIEGITSFSYFPLRLAVVFGFVLVFLSFCGIIWALIMKLLELAEVKGWSSIILLLLFLGGVQLIFLGFIGEYIGKIYFETKHRPIFIVKEIYSHKSTLP